MGLVDSDTGFLRRQRESVRNCLRCVGASTSRPISKRTSDVKGHQKLDIESWILLSQLKVNPKSISLYRWKIGPLDRLSLLIQYYISTFHWKLSKSPRLIVKKSLAVMNEFMKRLMYRCMLWICILLGSVGVTRMPMVFSVDFSRRRRISQTSVALNSLEC